MKIALVIVLVAAAMLVMSQATRDGIKSDIGTAVETIKDGK